MAVSSQNMEKTLKATHAYVVVYFKDETGIKILSGRERAIHRKAINDLFNKLKNPEKIYNHIQNRQSFWDPESANNRYFGIGRNFTGALLIGRTALPGGKIEDEDGENSIDAAKRELEEEFCLDVQASSLKHFKLVSITDKRHEDFYLLEIDKQCADQAIENFKKSSSTEKRELEVITVDELITRLEGPDNKDKAYIQAEVSQFVIDFCKEIEGRVKKKISEEGRLVFIQNLVNYELNRKFGQGGVVREIKSIFFKDVSEDGEKLKKELTDSSSAIVPKVPMIFSPSASVSSIRTASMVLEKEHAKTAFDPKF